MSKKTSKQACCGRSYLRSFPRTEPCLPLKRRTALYAFTTGHCAHRSRRSHSGPSELVSRSSQRWYGVGRGSVSKKRLLEVPHEVVTALCKVQSRATSPA